MINLLPTQETVTQHLDTDWIDLIIEAKNQGFSPEEIRSLLTILGSK